MSSRADFLRSMGLSEDDMKDPTVVTQSSKYQTTVSGGGGGNKPPVVSRSMKSAYDDDDDSRPLGSGIQTRSAAPAKTASYSSAPANTERYDSYVTSEGRDGRGEVDDDFMTRLREKQQRREAAGKEEYRSPDVPTRKPPQAPIVQQEDDTEPMFKKSTASDRAALINSCLSNDRVFMDGVPPPPARSAPPPSGGAYGGDRSAFLKSMGIDNAGGPPARGPPVSRPAHNLGADDDDDMLPPGRTAPPPVRDADEVVLQTALSHQELIRQRRAKAKAAGALKRAGGGGDSELASVESVRDAPTTSVSEVDAPRTIRNVYNQQPNGNNPTSSVPAYDRASQEYAKVQRPAAGSDSFRRVRELQSNNFTTPARDLSASSPDGTPQRFQPPPVTSDITLGSRKGNVYSQGNSAAPYREPSTSSAAPPASQFTTSGRGGGGYSSAPTSAGLNASPVTTSSSYRREDSTNFNSTTGSLGGTIRSEEDSLSAEDLKDMGNRFFESGDFRKAVRLYSKAIEKDASNAAIYSNRSAAYLQASKQMGIDTRTMALRDADKVVELRPTWFKGYSRQGDAHFKLEHFREAIKSYEKGLSFDADNVNLIHSLGEARNAAGGRVLKADDQWNNPWNTVENTTKAPKREFEGRSARELAMEHKESLYSTVGLGDTGRDYVSQELNKYRTQRSGTDSMNSTSTGATNTSAPAPPERSSYRATPSAQSAPSSGGNFDPTTFDSDAAAAYQQRLLEEYRRKKAMAGK